MHSEFILKVPRLPALGSPRGAGGRGRRQPHRALRPRPRPGSQGPRPRWSRRGRRARGGRVWAYPCSCCFWGTCSLEPPPLWLSGGTLERTTCLPCLANGAAAGCPPGLGWSCPPGAPGRAGSGGGGGGRSPWRAAPPGWLVRRVRSEGAPGEARLGAPAPAELRLYLASSATLKVRGRGGPPRGKAPAARPGPGRTTYVILLTRPCADDASSPAQSSSPHLSQGPAIAGPSRRPRRPPPAVRLARCGRPRALRLPESPGGGTRRTRLQQRKFCGLPSGPRPQPKAAGGGGGRGGWGGVGSGAREGRGEGSGLRKVRVGSRGRGCRGRRAGPGAERARAGVERAGRSEAAPAAKSLKSCSRRGTECQI